MIDKIIERLEEAKKRTLILIEPVATTSNRIIIESAYDCAIGIVKQVAAEGGCEHCEEGYYFDPEYGEMEGYEYCPMCGRKLQPFKEADQS